MALKATIYKADCSLPTWIAMSTLTMRLRLPCTHPKP